MIITFDIWDTIIKRKCHPEEIKLYTAKYIILKYEDKLKDEYKNIYKILIERDNIEAKICKDNKANGKDDECRIIDVFKQLQNKIFKEKMKDISEELLKEEIEQEKRSIFINPEILPIFEKYKDLKMYCISDFYMGEQHLKQLLDYLKLPVKIEKIFSSADYLLNKKTGNLYKKAEEELNIKPEEHIHVGDNQYSDIDIAKDLGIKTIKTTKTEFDFLPESNRKFNFDLSTAKKDCNSKYNKLFNVGVNLSPLIYFFVYSIVEYAIKNNIPKIYYFTREGETFIKIHQIIKQNNPFGVNLPECDTLEVSRMGTFSASLKEFSINELLRLWSQYRTQSIKTLFKTLAIDIEPYKKYFEKSKGIKNDNTPIFVVDIGWRGTIQDNLAHIFTNKQIGGYYLTLYDFYNLQPKNTFKYSYIDDKQIRDTEVASMITLLEWIYNPGTGSVIGYENGKAIRKAKDDEKNIVKEYIKPLQDGMLEGAKIINEYMKFHPYEANETKQYIYELLKRIKTNPEKTLIEAYYSMVFNDTFGTAKYVKKDDKLSTMQKLNIFKCRNILRQEPWKEAFIVYNNMGYMNMFMNFKAFIRKIIGKK